MTEKSDVIVEMHAIIQGYVQGVGFRATTCYMAEKLGISGTVCNLPDHSVEIYAQGSKLQLEKLIQLLKDKGPGHINSISTNYSTPEHSYEDFNSL